MFLVGIGYFTLVILFVAFMGTQVILPLIQGTVLWPMFRKSRLALESDLRELKEQLDEEELFWKVCELRKQVDEFRKELATDVDDTKDDKLIN